VKIAPNSSAIHSGRELGREEASHIKHNGTATLPTSLFRIKPPPPNSLSYLRVANSVSALNFILDLFAAIALVHNFS
jgi:hypothetical protein